MSINIYSYVLLTIISPKNSFWKETFNEFPGKVKKNFKAKGKKPKHLAFSICFLSEALSPPPMHSLNSVSNMSWLADARAYCACSEYFSKWYIYLCINNVSRLFKWLHRVIPHDNFFLPLESTYIKKKTVV